MILSLLIFLSQDTVDTTTVKWVIVTITPVIIALASVIGILWSKLNSKSKEYGDLLKEVQKELSESRQNHLNDIKEITNKYHDSSNSLKQAIDLLRTHLES